MKLTLIARIILGLIFTVLALNGFLAVLFNAGFIPMPPPEGEAGAFLGALIASGGDAAEVGYFWPFLKITEITCGILLLSNRLVPLALTVLAPVILNIMMFHIFLAPGGMLIGLIALVLEGYLAYSYREYFKGVLTVNTTARKAKMEEVAA